MKVIILFLNLVLTIPVVFIMSLREGDVFTPIYFIAIFLIGLAASSILPGILYLRKSITLQDFLIMSFVGPIFVLFLFYIGSLLAG